MENYLGFSLILSFEFLYGLYYELLSASAEPAGSRVAGRIWSGVQA